MGWQVRGPPWQVASQRALLAVMTEMAAVPRKPVVGASAFFGLIEKQVMQDSNLVRQADTCESLGNATVSGWDKRELINIWLREAVTLAVGQAYVAEMRCATILPPESFGKTFLIFSVVPAVVV